MPTQARQLTFAETVRAAVADVTEHGFDSAERIDIWTRRIREAALREMVSPVRLDEELRGTLRAIYERLVERGGWARYHDGSARSTIDHVKPQLRAQLDRRILASADLIRLNREQRIAETLRRFRGWATSIPVGGSDIVDKRETKENVRKAMQSLPYEERRVLTDQGHKLIASINETIAVQNNAIAGEWRSRWRSPGYNYREAHKERDGNVYLLRQSWAKDAGFVKAGEAGYYDEVTAVGEEPFCRCSMRWIYALRALPDDMLTAKGRRALV